MSVAEAVDECPAGAGTTLRAANADADADAVAAEAEAVDECPASEAADTVDCLQDARSWKQLQKEQGQEHERQQQ